LIHNVVSLLCWQLVWQHSVPQLLLLRACLPDDLKGGEGTEGERMGDGCFATSQVLDPVGCLRLSCVTSFSWLVPGLASFVQIKNFEQLFFACLFDSRRIGQNSLLVDKYRLKVTQRVSRAHSGAAPKHPPPPPSRTVVGMSA
jgi:hypothetical protein